MRVRVFYCIVIRAREDKRDSFEASIANRRHVGDFNFSAAMKSLSVLGGRGGGCVVVKYFEKQFARLVVGSLIISGEGVFNVPVACE